jgi:hypothetical protein
VLSKIAFGFLSVVLLYNTGLGKQCALSVVLGCGHRREIKTGILNPLLGVGAIDKVLG